MAPQLAGARADQHLPLSQPTAESRLDGRGEESGLRQPPEEIAARDSLGQRLLPGTDRERDLVGRGELLGDLETGVASTDN
jgi:hypothetical protein